MATKKKEKPKHLGRGLQSLLGPIINNEVNENAALPNLAPVVKYPPDKELHTSMGHIPIEAISRNPYQPRTVWDEQELAELSESIKTTGLIQPIVVREAEEGRYELIAGERRLRASKMAGLERIAAIVRRANQEQMLEIALVENIHRTDLNPIEHAKAYQNYIRTFSLTQADAARRLGKNRSVIANFLRLLDLPQEIRQMLVDGKLTTGHARAILALPTDELRRKLANRAMAGRLSVREVERLVRKYLVGTDKGENVNAGEAKEPHIVDLENGLSRELGTKVNIETRKNGRRGRIVIEFYSLDEFDRLTDRLGLSSVEQL